jgi:hypothetical protein
VIVAINNTIARQRQETATRLRAGRDREYRTSAKLMTKVEGKSHLQLKKPCQDFGPEKSTEHDQAFH